MDAGYSRRSLVEKLGIKPGYRVFLVDSPQSYGVTLGDLPAGVEVVSSLDKKIEFIQLFATRRHDLEAQFDALKDRLLPSGMLWVSWPKKSSQLATDLDENTIRAIGLAKGMVDVKVCAVDETWSGLKFVFRLKDR